MTVDQFFQEAFKYIPAVLVILYFVNRRVKMNKVRLKLPDLISRGALIVDVRTPAEYKKRHGDNSINIPLDELEKRLSELNKAKPVILCCFSGARSRVAQKILEKNGFEEIYNVGPWTHAG